jgi:hypothetical protein
MTALAADRQYSTKEVFFVSSLLVKGATKIYMGGMVCLGATGYAIPAADAAAMVGPQVQGVAMDSVDNSAGADGAKRVRIIHGIVSMINDTDAVGLTELGKSVYVKDDSSVRKAVGTNSVVAGTLVSIDVEGVIWVKFA